MIVFFHLEKNQKHSLSSGHTVNCISTRLPFVQSFLFVEKILEFQRSFLKYSKNIRKALIEEPLNVCCKTHLLVSLFFIAYDFFGCPKLQFQINLKETFHLK